MAASPSVSSSNRAEDAGAAAIALQPPFAIRPRSKKLYGGRVACECGDVLALSHWQQHIALQHQQRRVRCGRHGIFTRMYMRHLLKYHTGGDSFSYDIGTLGLVEGQSEIKEDEE